MRLNRARRVLSQRLQRLDNLSLTDYALNLTLYFLFGNSLTLLIQLFITTQPQLNLRSASLEIELERDER